MAPRNDSDLDWWVISPENESQGSTLDPTVPAGTKIVSTTKGSAEDNAFMNLDSYNGYVRFMGPFTSKSAASSAKPPGGLTEIGNLLNLAGTGAASEAAGGVSNFTGSTNPLDALGDIANFFDTLTQANTWKRVGLVVGGLIVVGLSLKAAISGQTPAQAAKQTAKTAVKTAAVVAPK